jgi:hypothetical protein
VTQIARDPEAFSVGAPQGRRRPRVTFPGHLAWIRTLPCVITGRRDVEAAHIRFGDTRCGKPAPGMGAKPDDIFVLPLCREKHEEQHRGSEWAFWKEHGIDPHFVALALWAATGDDERAAVILRTARGAYERLVHS